MVQVFRGEFLGGIWSGLIGLFLNRAAQSGYRQVLVRQALQGERVRRFMNSHPVAVPPALDLRTWVEDYVYRYHRKLFPLVSADGRLEGVITTRALAEAPRAEWERQTVGEVMRHDLESFTISPDADAMDALVKMQRTETSRLLVSEGDRLVGIVSLKDLLRFLNLKLELDAAQPNGPGPDAGREAPTHRGLPTHR
jgi:CBS domain-containing protein